MDSSRYLLFGAFRLDRIEGRLWRDAVPVHLSRKAQGLLTHLAGHAGQLVTKEELLTAVWPRSVVVEGVLTTAVREVRRALDDRKDQHAFIQTVHGRGYRFIAPVTPCDSIVQSTRSNRVGNFVGREPEWALLRERFGDAFAGQRQLVFVAGESGIGKTALVDAFVAQLATESSLTIMHGQCVEQYGTGEAYLPILEALGRLGRDRNSLPITEVLRAYAPSWLVHMPSLLPSDERLRLSATPQATSVRMMRELTEALDQMALQRPLVLILEDLHWSDTATLDWLAYVARRRDPARLLILATYRPVDAIVHSLALRTLVGELERHAQCTQLMLDYLAPEAVEHHVSSRFNGLPETLGLAQLLYKRTSGHPLFLVTILDSLLRDGLLQQESNAWRLRGPLAAVADVLPVSVRQLIERKIDRLAAEDQIILEAASVAGETFAVAAITAAVTSHSEEQIEARCSQWVREQEFLLEAGSHTWPDGTASSCFAFRHALFHDVVYRRMPVGRRLRLHRAIGHTLAAGYRQDPAAIAAELAVHFEQGGDILAASSYLEQASERAVQRSAYKEALRHAAKALALLEQCPESSDSTARQLRLQLTLGTALMATKGWAVPEVEQAHWRAKELCEQLCDADRLVTVVWGLIAVNVVRADLQRTRALSEQLLDLTRERHTVPFQLAGHMELAGVAFSLGELSVANEEFAIAYRLYEPAQHRMHVMHAGVDLGVFLRSWWSHLLWQLGDTRRAVAMSEDAQTLARSLGHPFTRAIALSYAALLQQFLRDTAAATALSEQAITLCNEHGFSYYRTWAQIVRGWCLADQATAPDAVTQITDGIATLTDACARRHLPYFHALLAEVHLKCGALDQADCSIAMGLQIAGSTGECWWQPELLRIRGAVNIACSPHDTAESRSCTQAAFDLASQHGNRSLMLRAGAALARLPQPAASRREALRTLATVCEAFDETRATWDLDEARAVLQRGD